MTAKLTLVAPLPEHVRAATTLPDVVSAQGLAGCIDADGTCGGKLSGRGRCHKHYMRWWRATPREQRKPALHLKRATPAQRFWAKVDRREADECWPWKGSTWRGGYGEFYVSPTRGKVAAHVFARELTTGEPCPDGMEGCHHCDNPPCCNPAHIYYGTRQDNVDDMLRRNRMPRGERRGQAKLRAEQVLQIRGRFADGDTQAALAVEYGVSPTYISQIVNGRVWRHVGGPTRTHGRPGRRPITRKAA